MLDLQLQYGIVTIEEHKQFIPEIDKMSAQFFKHYINKNNNVFSVPALTGTH